MYHIQGRLILSATDLVKFAACEHLTQLELAAAADAIQQPEEHNELAEVLQKRGAEHELRYLEFLRKSGRDVVELPGSGRTSMICLRPTPRPRLRCGRALT